MTGELNENSLVDENDKLSLPEDRVVVGLTLATDVRAMVNSRSAGPRNPISGFCVNKCRF